MLLRPDTLALTALLAVLISLGPLSTDMYLPSLPDISTLLQASTADVQLTLSIFLVGFAVGQLFYGPISDRYGRKPVLLAALAVYVVASFACALATSIGELILYRFIQAIGGCGPIVLARAIVRDLYAGPRAGQELARMGTIMGLVPAIAPVIGGVLHVSLGWRSTFWATALFGAGSAALVAFSLPETLRSRSTTSLSPVGIVRTFASMTRDRAYLAYMAMNATAYAGLFAFISGSSFVLQGLHGLSPQVYGAAFGSVVLGFISGSVIGGRITGRQGLDASIGIGVACLAAGGCAMTLALLAGVPGVLAILVPMTVYTVGVGMVMPQSMAAALTPYAERAGSASSFLGFVQMSFAALTGVAVGHGLGTSAWPLVIAVTGMGLAGLVTFHLSHGARAARMPAL